MKEVIEKDLRVLILIILLLGLSEIGLAPVFGDSSPNQQGVMEDWVLIISGGFNDTNQIGINNFVEYDGYLYASVYNKVNGPEIWRTKDFTHWEMVVRNGLGNPRNSGILLFASKGNFYAGTFNKEDGAEIWFSNDGVSFTRIISEGLGDKDNIGIFSSPILFKDKILVPVQNGQVGSIRDGAEIWISEDGKTFERSQRGGLGDPSNIGIYLLPTPFKDHLYLSTYNPVNGGEIWRTKDEIEWEKVVDDGFGDKGNIIIHPLVIFKDHLYAVTYNLNGLNIFRSEDGKNWEKVVESGFNYGSYRNVWGSLNEINGVLYLTTMSTPRIGAFQLWRSNDGQNWTQVGRTGFGNDNNYFAGISMGPDGQFYLSTTNVMDGVEVWKSKDSKNWEMIFKEDRGYTSHTGAGLYYFKNRLYLLIYDIEKGIEVWEYKEPLVITTTATIAKTSTKSITSKTSSPTLTRKSTTTSILQTSTSQQPTTDLTITRQSITTMSTLTTAASGSGWGVMEYAIITSAAAAIAVALYFILKTKLLARPPLPPPPP
jgi:hypothetical protein